jgi:DNA-binding CsgD family transcriptional regulator
MRTGLWDLTRREAEVARLVVRGLQNFEVAQVLGLSINTVRNTLVRVFEKARATTRAELAFLAHQAPSLLTSAPNAGLPTEDGVLGFSLLVRQLAEVGGKQLGTRATDLPRAGPIYSAPDLL